MARYKRRQKIKRYHRSFYSREMKIKRIAGIVVLAAAVLAGLLHLKCYAFGGYSLTNILLYLGPNLDYANFRNALLLVGFMLIMSFITVNLIGFDDSCYEETAVAAQDAAE